MLLRAITAARDFVRGGLDRHKGPAIHPKPLIFGAILEVITFRFIDGLENARRSANYKTSTWSPALAAPLSVFRQATHKSGSGGGLINGMGLGIKSAVCTARDYGR